VDRIGRTDPILVVDGTPAAAANLAAFVSAGYSDVTTVASDAAAAAALRSAHAALQDADIRVGPLAEVLSGMPDDSYRLAISVGVLTKAGAEADRIATDLARLAGRLALVEHDVRGPAELGATLRRLGYREVARARAARSLGGTAPGLRAHTVRQLQRMDSLATLRKFWTQERPPGNVPADYLVPVARSKALLEMISDLPADSRILEVGCNVGRNLAYLHDHGYRNVEGIEINPHAVAMLRESFPQLADNAIHLGPAGEHLPGFADDSYDLVFTMAVIEHIHPDEAFIFDDFVRVSPRVLSIEPKRRHTHRQFPHDVEQVFTSRGMTLLWERPMSYYLRRGEDDALRRSFYSLRFTRLPDEVSSLADPPRTGAGT
jgi:SAM-dependent methyltransferase